MPPPENTKEPDLPANGNAGDEEKGQSQSLGNVPKSSSSNGDTIKPENPKPSEPADQLSSLKTFLLIGSVFLAMFLVAVDRTIISTVGGLLIK